MPFRRYTAGRRARASAGPSLAPQVGATAAAHACSNCTLAAPAVTPTTMLAVAPPGGRQPSVPRAAGALPPPLCSLDMSASKSENGDAHRLDPELAVRLKLPPRPVPPPLCPPACYSSCSRPRPACC